LRRTVGARTAGFVRGFLGRLGLSDSEGPAVRAGTLAHRVIADRHDLVVATGLGLGDGDLHGEVRMRKIEAGSQLEAVTLARTAGLVP
jgi:hypothetical protein